MQGAFRPPDAASAARRTRRFGLLFQMSRNGTLVHADNSDLSYKAILARVASEALGAPERPTGPAGEARGGGAAAGMPGVEEGQGTYGLALEALARAPQADVRRVLVAAALLRVLQEVALARAVLAAPLHAPERPRDEGVAPWPAAGFLARALKGAASAFDFARPLLPENSGPEGAPAKAMERAGSEGKGGR